MDEVKFKEIVIDPKKETETEIDPVFPYMKNIYQFTVLNDRMTEHNFSINLN